MADAHYQSPSRLKQLQGQADEVSVKAIFLLLHILYFLGGRYNEK
jgi:hypothetical protein